MNRWSETDLMRVFEMWQGGATWRQIGDEFGADKNNVSAAISRLRRRFGEGVQRRVNRETRPRLTSIRQIKQEVCRVYGVTETAIDGQSHSPSVVKPRHVAIALAYRLTGLSTTVVGKHFGGRDHTTVLHAIARANERHSDAVAEIESAILARLEAAE